jgi:hypothetical protein
MSAEDKEMMAFEEAKDRMLLGVDPAIGDDRTVDISEFEGGAVNIAHLVGELDRIKKEIDTREEALKGMKAIEKDLTLILAQKMRAENAESIRTESGARATLHVVAHTTIKDWTALCSFVKATGHFEVFQKRVTEKACEEVKALKGLPSIPGTETFNEDRIRFTKSKGV